MQPWGAKGEASRRLSRAATVALNARLDVAIVLPNEVFAES